jgi:hypothetical protein
MNFSICPQEELPVNVPSRLDHKSLKLHSPNKCPPPGECYIKYDTSQTGLEPSKREQRATNAWFQMDEHKSGRSHTKNYCRIHLHDISRRGKTRKPYSRAVSLGLGIG